MKLKRGVIEPSICSWIVSPVGAIVQNSPCESLGMVITHHLDDIYPTKMVPFSSTTSNISGCSTLSTLPLVTFELMIFPFLKVGLLYFSWTFTVPPEWLVCKMKYVPFFKKQFPFSGGHVHFVWGTLQGTNISPKHGILKTGGYSLSL